MSIPTFLALSAIRYLSSGISSFSSTTPQIPELYAQPLPQLEMPSWHPKEDAYRSHFTPDFYKKYFGVSDYEGILNFNPHDQRNKFLFAAAESGSHAPGDSLTTALVEDLHKKYDLKYKVVKTYDEFCEEIAQTSKTTKLSYVLLEGEHYQDKGICLSNCSDSRHLFHAGQNLKHCFQDLDPQGQIILYSDHSGSAASSLAQLIVDATKHSVIAPIANLKGRTSIRGSKKLKLFNAEKFDLANIKTYIPNRFKTFFPKYTECQEVNQTALDKRELQVVDITTDNIEEKNEDVLKLCKDDPKQKLLYLSMEADHNNALKPDNNYALLRALAQNYDLKFKTIKSYPQFCKEIQSTAGIKKLNVLVDGHGNSTGITINNTTREKLHSKMNWTECVQGADIARITLLACNTNAPVNGDTQNNFAHALANQTKIPVQAATEATYPKKIQVTSLDPLEVYHPSECDPLPCSSTVNAFQIIDPPEH